MLKIDFEQAFVLHNDYKDSERALFELALKVLAFPLAIIGAIISAGIVSSVDSIAILIDWPIIWLSLIVAGILNLIVVRAYVVTDRVQTESKRQVNALRSLYLTSMKERFPDGWEPVWGSTNPYLETKAKLKAAVLTPIILGATNSLYVAYGSSRLLSQTLGGAWLTVLTGLIAVGYFLLQMEFTWNLVRRLLARRRRSTHPHLTQ